MKYLILVGVLLVVYLLWRSSERRSRDPAATAKPTTPALPQDMVRCPVCSLHLPRVDALPGTTGRLYCSAEHRVSGGD